LPSLRASDGRAPGLLVAVFAYFNNDVDGHAIENARGLARLVTRQQRRAGIRAVGHGR